MKYNKRSARELYDGVVREINDLRIEAARIDGRLAALNGIRVDLYEQMMAEQQEQEETTPDLYEQMTTELQDPTRNKLFQPK